MSDSLHALRRAIAAIKSGDKATGRELLVALIRGDPRNESAWLWMSAVTDSDEQRRACLERVLAINPNNPTAHQGLVKLQQRQENRLRAGQAVGQSALSPPASLPKGAGSASPAAGRAERTAKASPTRVALWGLLIALGIALLARGAAGVYVYFTLVR